MTTAASNPPKVSIRRWLLPLVVFVLTMGVQAFYVRHEARQPVQGWAADSAIVDNGLWGFRPYMESRNYLTGYSYALPLAFAAVALRRYRECRQRRKCAAGKAAVGGITLSAALAGSGCFLLGCCGSPMLGIYLSFFGAAFLPLVKPLIAAVTTLMVAFSYYWWIWRPIRNDAKLSSERCEPDCGCEAPASAKIRPNDVARPTKPAWKTMRP